MPKWILKLWRESLFLEWPGLSYNFSYIWGILVENEKYQREILISTYLPPAFYKLCDLEQVISYIWALVSFLILSKSSWLTDDSLVLIQ